MNIRKFKQNEIFFNRELSWLKFNQRVLEEAADATNPLLERLKFLCIFSSNLDEFFMIRIAGLREQVIAQIHKRSPDGLTPAEQILKISAGLSPLLQEHSRILRDEVLPELEKHKVKLLKFNQLNNPQKKQLREYFDEKVFPVLTPLAIDPSHPFPKLRNLGLNFLVELQDPEDLTNLEPMIAVVPVPTHVLESIYQFKGKDGEFILLEEIIENNLEKLFPNIKILNAFKFRVTRNADLDISEAEADDLLKLIERELRKRNLGRVIRLDLESSISEYSRKILQEGTDLADHEIFIIPDYLEMSVFWELIRRMDKPLLKDEPFTPALHEQTTRFKNIFEAIRFKDILLHHPYDSFWHVVDLIKEAANDKNVLAIKITLYRTSGPTSPIVMALKEAVANGKNVTALIELKARFDEMKNIEWAKALEREGVNVVYGVMGLKTHCKTLQIIRKEGEELQSYVHLSTGNYNENSAKIYTDFSLLSADRDLGKDISELFNFLTGYSKQSDWRKIFVAPINLRSHFEEQIEKCIEEHSEENPSKIKIVMNSLVDPNMIRMLYAASQQGVKVDLIVRGICCLVPGVPGLSENITVRSIVGRFLEHSRIYAFYSNLQLRVYLGSADWMERNLNRRVELVFEITDTDLKAQILEILKIMYSGNVKTRFLDAEGNYTKKQLAENESGFNVQEFFLSLAETRQKRIDTTTTPGLDL